MLVLRTLILTAFRSFARKGSISLAGQGLTYVAGRNEVEPALGANGAGKTTLFEALFWVLFGKTSRNLRASDVSTWDSDATTEVSLAFSSGSASNTYVVSRTWNPVLLTLDGSPITQEALEQILGYSSTTFLYSVFHAQFGEFFADLQPSAQLAIYTEVLGLDLWEAASDLAAVRANDAEKELNKHTVTLTQVSTRLTERQRALNDLEERECAWYREHISDLRSFWKQIHKVEENLRTMEDSLKVLQVDSDAGIELGVKLKLEEEKMDEKRDAEKEVQYTLRSLEQKLVSLDRVEEGLGGLTRCPKCFQQVDKKTATNHIYAERSEITATLHDAVEKLAKLTKNRKKLEKKYVESAAVLREIEKKKQQAVGAATADAQSLAKERKQLLRDVAEYADTDCPFNTVRAQQSLEEAREQTALAKGELKAAQQAVAAYSYWTKAFREIRLSLIKSSLAQFEISTNNALHALGMEDWAIEYAVEAETKTGKLKRGFSIAVRSPYNNEVAPFAAWSGGESQRLRLAVAFGLSDLIQDFSGASCNIEIFDEPTAHLSERGIQDLLGVLEQRAEERERAVWLVDHHVLDWGGFAKTLTVVKTEQGSAIA